LKPLMTTVGCMSFSIRGWATVRISPANKRIEQKRDVRR